MALRLRRGTDAERQIITPVEGELVYVTDTKELYIGDGTTVGGIRVTGEVADTLDGLTDVDAALPQDGDVLVYDSLTSEWESVQLLLADLPDVNTDGILDGQVLAWDGDAQTFVPANNEGGGSTIVGDLVGSVFADDSSVIVDAIDNRIIAQQIISNGFEGTLTGQLAGSVFAEDNATVIVDGTNNRVIAEEISSNVFLGDINGSILGDDSSIVLNHETGELIGSLNTTSSQFELATITSDITFNLGASDAPMDLVLNLSDNLRVKQAITPGNIVGFTTNEISRGSIESPTAVQTDDELGGLLIKGYNGSTYANAGVISFIVDSTSSITDGGDFIKSIVAISASTDTSQNESDALLLDSAGVVTSNAFVANAYMQLPTYADATARDAAITSPAEGMTVFNTALQKFQGYVTDTGLAGGGASNSTAGWIDLN